MFLAGTKALTKGVILAPKLTSKLAGKATEFYINKRMNELDKKYA